MRWILLATMCLGTLAWRSKAQPETQSGAAVVAEKRVDALVFDFIDPHEQGRVIAEVAVELWSDGGKLRLVAMSSASGARIEAQPGFEGQAGGNRRTASELTRLAEGGLTFEVRSAEELHHGSVHASRRGRLPVRRLRPDGSLDLNGVDVRERVLEMQLETPPLAPGAWIADVMVDGVPRLTIEFNAERIAAVYGEAFE